MNTAVNVGWSIFESLDYAGAVALVRQSPETRYRLRQRIEEDSSADPVDAVADAELLLALAKLRLREALEHARTTTH